MSKLNEDGLYLKYIHTDFVHTDRLLCKRPWQDTPVFKDTNEPPPLPWIHYQPKIIMKICIIKNLHQTLKNYQMEDFLRQHKKVPKSFLNSKMCLKSQF